MANEKIKGFKCPSCGNETLTYNGNYFCTYFECNWVNPEVDLKLSQESDFILELQLYYMRENQKDTEWNYMIDPIVTELERRRV